MPRSRVSYSSTAPTSRRSEVALPPTATAWAGCSISTPSKMSSMRSRTLRISAAEGGSEEISSSARAPEPTRQERTSSAPPGTLPRITSVEPPPTSTTPIRPSTGWPRVLVAPMKESLPSSSSLQHVDPHPGRLADRRRHRLAVAGLADRRGRDRADLLGAELAGQPHLGGHHLADLIDLLRPDRPVAVERLVDPRVGALLHHLLQLPVDRLGDEHAGRVGADIYGSAEHRGGSPPCSQTRRISTPGEGPACLRRSGAKRPRTRGTAR